MSEKKIIIENKLIERFNKEGKLSEEEIIDICIDYDLDLVEIDELCDKLLRRKILVTDESGSFSDEDNLVDRSHIDYEDFLYDVEKHYPNMKPLIDSVRVIRPPQSKEWQSLIVEAQRGNQYARERIVNMYTRTVMKQAYSFSKSYNTSFEESFSDGIIGLYNAIEKYDITSPDSFVTYYGLWVRQSMQRSCSFGNTGVYYPMHVKEKVLYLISEIIAKTGIENCEEYDLYFTADELTDICDGDSSIQKYIMPLKEIEETDSFYSPMVDVENDLFWEQFEDDIEKCLKVLKEREYQVLIYRFNLDTGGKMRTLEECGQHFNLTRERIRQIEAHALRRMKQNKETFYLLKKYMEVLD